MSFFYTSLLTSSARLLHLFSCFTFFFVWHMPSFYIHHLICTCLLFTPDPLLSSFSPVYTCLLFTPVILLLSSTSSPVYTCLLCLYLPSFFIPALFYTFLCLHLPYYTYFIVHLFSPPVLFYLSSVNTYLPHFTPIFFSYLFYLYHLFYTCLIFILFLRLSLSTPDFFLHLFYFAYLLFVLYCISVYTSLSSLYFLFLFCICLLHFTPVFILHMCTC